MPQPVVNLTLDAVRPQPDDPDVLALPCRVFFETLDITRSGSSDPLIGTTVRAATTRIPAGPYAGCACFSANS